MNWKDPLIGALCGRNSCDSPFDAVRACIQNLIRQSRIHRPPFPPETIARLRGIRDVVAVPLKVDARLIPEGSSYIIEVNSAHTKQRQNFSCAHEIVHTFFLDLLEVEERHIRMRSYHGDSQEFGSNEEEILCNFGASELLMPSAFFDRRAAGLEPSFDSLRCLSQEFDVSFEAAARKWIEVSQWKAILAKWAWAGTLHPGTFELRWSKSTRGIRSHLPFGTEPPEQIHLAYANRTSVSGKVRLSLGGPEDNFFMESKWLGGTQSCVLSLVVLEPMVHRFKSERARSSRALRVEPRAAQIGLDWNKKDSQRRVPDFLRT